MYLAHSLKYGIALSAVNHSATYRVKKCRRAQTPPNIPTPTNAARATTDLKSIRIAELSKPP